jgi:hypothetical protein
MSAPKNTPGPWQIVMAGDGPAKPVIADDNFASLLTVVHEDGIKFAAVYNEADARLIAAAPELLEALIVCESNISSLLASNHPKVFGEWLAVVRAAIARATGDATRSAHSQTDV